MYASMYVCMCMWVDGWLSKKRKSVFYAEKAALEN